MEVLNSKNFGATAPKRGAVGEILDIFKFSLSFFLPRPEAAEILGEKVGIFGILVGKMSKIVTFSGILANPLVSTHPRPNSNPNPNPNPNPVYFSLNLYFLSLYNIIKILVSQDLHFHYCFGDFCHVYFYFFWIIFLFLFFLLLFNIYIRLPSMHYTIWCQKVEHDISS